MSNRPTLSSGDRKRFLSSAFKSFSSPQRDYGTPETARKNRANHKRP